MHDETDEERFATIRGLIDRGRIYSDVFATTAFITGTLSILTAGAMYLNDEVKSFLNRPVRPREFAFTWIDIFVLAAVVFAMFLWRAKKMEGDRFITTRMKFALRSIFPCLLVPLAYTGWFLSTGFLGAAELDLVAIWILFYGLALLSTAAFSPRSIYILGWAFLLTGLSVPVVADLIDAQLGSAPIVLMGLTFGVYHLIFAMATWSQLRTRST